MELTFETKEHLLKTLECGDLYCPDLERYLFLYNDDGGICSYRVTPTEATTLAKETSNSSENSWSAFLGAGGEIFDNPQDAISKSDQKETWVLCTDWLNYIKKEELV